MANSSSPYRRIGSNSWKELLDQVNEKLENPEPGCDPIDPIQEPEECHRWAKSDIREVHNKLDEMPENCFTWQDIPDLWKVSIIEDIENQLEEAWCDCDNEVCCYYCQGSGNDRQFLATETVGPNDCTSCGSSQATQAACNDIRDNQYEPARSDWLNGWSDFAQGHREACCYQNQLDKLNEELEKLEDQLEQIEQNKADCKAACTGEDASACQAACDATYDPQIEDKEAEIEEKEEEITEKEQELAEAEQLRDEGESMKDGKCAEMNSAIDAMIWCDYTSIRDFADGYNEIAQPQGFLECPPRTDGDNGSSDNGPDGPNPCECGFEGPFASGNIWRCRVSYSLYRRTYETQNTACNGTPLPLYDSGFRPAGGGLFDPETGEPCHTSDQRSWGCTAVHLLYFCYSSCCCCSNACGGSCCIHHPNNDYNYDWEINIRQPTDRDPTDQAGGPCGDGEIGGGPVG